MESDEQFSVVLLEVAKCRVEFSAMVVVGLCVQERHSAFAALLKFSSSGLFVRTPSEEKHFLERLRYFHFSVHIFRLETLCDPLLRLFVSGIRMD